MLGPAGCIVASSEHGRLGFPVSGLEHAKFTQIVAELTTAGSNKVAAAAAALGAAA